MPGGDRTGPWGAGPHDGQGFRILWRRKVIRVWIWSWFWHETGFCQQTFLGPWLWQGYFGYVANPPNPEDEKVFLQEQKDILRNQLEAIEKQLKICRDDGDNRGTLRLSLYQSEVTVCPYFYKKKKDMQHARKHQVWASILMQIKSNR